jgi:hypothetical protein
MRINNIFRGHWKKVLAAVLTITILTTPAFTGFAAAKESGLLSDIAENDIDFNILLEVVNSDMEEKAVINKDGTVSNYYSSAAQAGVSEKAFQEFEAMLVSINKEVKAGNVEFGEGLFDVKFYEPKVTINLPYGVYCFSNSQIRSALKIIGAGGGIAAVAAALGVTPLIAAAFVMLYSIGDLCNYYDKGMCILHLGPSYWRCVPLR